MDASDRRSVLLTLGYACVIVVLAQIMSNTVIGGRDASVPPVFLNGFLSHHEVIPPLARWDSIWYYAISQYGYGLSIGTWEGKAGFFPLLPVVVGSVSGLLHLNVFWTGIIVSICCAAAALVFLLRYLRIRFGVTESEADYIQFIYLCSPAAFILVSFYSESMFIMLVVIGLWARASDRTWLCFIVFFLAGLTRIHALAFAAAILVDAAYCSWRAGKIDLKRFLGGIGAFLGVGSYFGYLWWTFGDPFHYVDLKQNYWGNMTQDIFVSWWSSIPSSWSVVSYSRLMALTDNFLPLLYGVALVWLVRRKYVLEAGIIIFVILMSVVNGTFWGFSRYSLFLFSALAILRPLSHHRYGYCLSLSLIAIQFCFLFQFVFSIPPAP